MALFGFFSPKTLLKGEGTNGIDLIGRRPKDGKGKDLQGTWGDDLRPETLGLVSRGVEKSLWERKNLWKEASCPTDRKAKNCPRRRKSKRGPSFGLGLIGLAFSRV